MSDPDDKFFWVCSMCELRRATPQHPCPYQIAIFGNEANFCDCCAECEAECKAKKR